MKFVKVKSITKQKYQGKIYDLEVMNTHTYNIENIVGIGAGTYILKEYYTDVLKFFDKQAKELKEFTLNNLYDVLTYEFANHELEISLSYSYKSFLIEWVGLSEKEIEENKDEINKAIADYRTEFYKHN